MGLISISKPNDVCLSVVKTLKDIAGQNTPTDLNPLQYGTTEAIRDAASQSGAMQVDISSLKEPYTAGATSNNRFGIRYRVRRCNDDASVSLDPCENDGVNSAAWQYLDFTFGTPISHGFDVKLATQRRACEGYNEEFAALLRETYDTLKRKTNARYISQLAANLGGYYALDCEDSVNSDDFQATIAFYDTAGQPKPQGLFKVKQQYNLFGYGGEPAVIGGSPLDAIDFARPLYQNNENGFNFNRVQGMRLFKDYQVNGVLANAQENVLSLAPGSARILNWNRFVGDYAYSSDTTIKRTLDLGAAFGEAPGQFVVDHQMHIQECGVNDVVYIHKFFVYTDLFMLTPAMLSADCGQCSNGILLWKHDCADGTCDDFNPVITEPEGEG